MRGSAVFAAASGRPETISRSTTRGSQQQHETLGLPVLVSKCDRVDLARERDEIAAKAGDVRP